MSFLKDEKKEKINCMKIGATVLSYLLHPLWMPLLGVFILFHSGNYLSLMPVEGQNAIFLIIATSTILLPLSVIPFFMYQNLFKSLQMSEKHERLAPYAVSMIFYLFGFYILQRVGAPRSLLLFILGGTFCIFVSLLITMKWKISAHMIALGGLTGMLISIAVNLMADVGGWLLLVLLFSGLAGSSRMALKEHTTSQVFSGFLVGLSVMVLTFMLANRL